MSKTLANKLAKALDGTGIYQSVEISGTANKISIMGRVVNNADTQWLTLVTKILTLTEEMENTWECHICKNFFLKREQLVFGWGINITAKSLAKALDLLIPCVMQTNPIKKKNKAEPDLEDIEVPLTDLVVGESAAELLPGRNIKDRNVPKPGSKRGAYSYQGGRAP